MRCPVRRLLVCSLGNPAPTYSNTRHAAGHFILHRISSLLHTSPIPLSHDRKYGGPIAFDHTFTLFQSPTLMNISGRAVRTAWNAFKSSLAPEDVQEARLVVLHDELEKDLGRVKLKLTGSGGGQKGVEDCIKALGTSDFIRVGIGISRPKSKDPNVIADYVLGKLTSQEMERLEDESVPKVAEILQRLAKEKTIPRPYTA